MPFRTVCLRVMLWSLAIAAATGVVSVLTQSSIVAWRVVGTAITTGVAAGLLLPTSAMIDRRKTRPAGLVGMGAVIIEFLLVLALIWQLWRAVGGYHEQALLITAVLLGLAGAATMLLMSLMTVGPQFTLAGRVALFAILTALGAALLGTWWDRFAERWWETSGAVGSLGMTAALCFIGVDQGRSGVWRWPGLTAIVVGCGMWLVNIWIGTGSDLGTIIFTILISLGAVTAHANVCLACSLPVRQRWVQLGTITVGTLTAVLICRVVIEVLEHHRRDVAEFYERCAAASGIVTGCGTLALVVLARLNRRIDYEPLPSELTDMTVVCPRCGKKQSVPLGDATCAGCELRISIRIEEPRCRECGYLLYGLTSDRCPECGTELVSEVASRHADPAQP